MKTMDLARPFGSGLGDVAEHFDIKFLDLSFLVHTETVLRLGIHLRCGKRQTMNL